MEEPADIGKITIIVNQGKEFVVKTRYTLTKKPVLEIIFLLEYGFLSVRRKKMGSSRVF